MTTLRTTFKDSSEIIHKVYYNNKSHKFITYDYSGKAHRFDTLAEVYEFWMPVVYGSWG